MSVLGFVVRRAFRLTHCVVFLGAHKLYCAGHHGFGTALTPWEKISRGTKGKDGK